MASLKSILKLEDQMSKQLKSIKTNLDYVNQAMQNTDQLSGQMFKIAQEETALASKKLQQMGADIDLIKNKTTGLKNPIKGSTEEFEKMRLKIEDIATYALGNLLANAANNLFMSIKQGIADAISYASGLQEIQNVVDVTFASSSKEIDQWAQTTLDNFGLSELAAKNYVSTMGSMLKASGLTQEQTVEMSKTVAQLAGDVASFRDISADAAFQKLTAIVTGETKPMRQLGVNMTVANLEAYALAQGINKTWNEMSQAEQVTLRYNYVLDSLTDVQGDFTRTSGSYANQQRLLTENWKQFSSTLAAYVLPFLTLLLQGLNSVVAFLSDHTDTVMILLTTLIAILGVLGAKALWAGTASLIAGAQAAVAWVGALWPLLLIIATIGILLAVLNELGIGVSQVVGFIAGLFGALSAFIYNGVVLLTNTFGSFAVFLQNLFQNPVAAVQLLFYDMAINVISYVKSIAQSLEDFLNSIPFVSVDLTSGIEGVLSGLEEGRDALVEANDLATFTPMEMKNMSDAWGEWSTIAQNGLNSFAGLGNNPASALLSDWEPNQTGTLGNDSVLDKVNSVGKIEDDIGITDEDIELLKDVATVDYVNKFVTMTPSISVQFGDVHETADVNELTQVMSEMIQEAAATALV